MIGIGQHWNISGPLRRFQPPDRTWTKAPHKRLYGCACMHEDRVYPTDERWRKLRDKPAITIEMCFTFSLPVLFSRKGHVIICTCGNVQDHSEILPVQLLLMQDLSGQRCRPKARMCMYALFSNCCLPLPLNLRRSPAKGSTRRQRPHNLDAAVCTNAFLCLLTQQLIHCKDDQGKTTTSRSSDLHTSCQSITAHQEPQMTTGIEPDVSRVSSKPGGGCLRTNTICISGSVQPHPAPPGLAGTLWGC